MSQPLLSIVVPVYNTEKYLIRCIDSLLNQSYTNLEIIIVNDGSSDNSHNLIMDCYSLTPKIKYIPLTNNMGLGNARNIGIQNSNGEYITFVDSDDWVDLDLYTVVLDKLRDNPAEIAVFGVQNEYDNLKSSTYRYNYLFENKISSNQAMRLLTKEQNNNYFISTVVWNKVYRTDVIKNNQLLFLNNSYWEDDIFSFEVLMQINNVQIVPGVFYHYYNRPYSITNCITKKHIDDLFFSFNHLKNKLNTNNTNQAYTQAFTALLDKCVCFLIDMIFKNENDISNQKKYIAYLMDSLIKNYSFNDIFEYLDIQRIKRLFNYTI